MKNAILILLAFSCFVSADDFLETIRLPGNECFSSITAIKSGDFMAAGVDVASDDILVFKFSDSGSIQRAQKFAGSGSDEAQAIVGTSDGGAVVVGNTNSFGVGLLDGFILKVSSSGTILWKRTFGTSGNEHFVRIVQTRDRGFIVLADADHDPNLNDVVVVKFNSGGHPVWRKVFSAAGFDHASDLAFTSDNGAIVAIASDFSDGVRSIVVKLRSNGSVEWSRVYGSSGNHVGLSVFQAPGGGYHFTEAFAASGSRSDLVVSKLDSTGIPLWSRIYRSPGASLQASIIADGDDLILSGNITAPAGGNSRGVVFKLDDDGNILWRKKVKPDSRPVFLGKPLVFTPDDSILVSGCSGDSNANNMDSIVLKINSSGQIQGGCPKLTNFGLSNAQFELTSAPITLDEIPVPFLNSTAGFQVTTLSASESFVCFSGD
jgi:hypothetical protein